MSLQRSEQNGRNRLSGVKSAILPHCGQRAARRRLSGGFMATILREPRAICQSEPGGPQSSAIASTLATCIASRPAPSRIWCRQLNPSATTRVVLEAARTPEYVVHARGLGVDEPGPVHARDRADARL